MSFLWLTNTENLRFAVEDCYADRGWEVINILDSLPDVSSFDSTVLTFRVAGTLSIVILASLAVL